MSDNVLAGLTAALAGRYAVERELGSGGMALVFLAEDLKHHRKVAVKVLRPHLAAALGADRFLREIEIAAQLTHPHILPLHDSGESGGFLYYVMPFVEGESLRDRLRRDAALPIADVVRLLRDVVDALAYAHEHSVVHRDIKPDNVMLAGRHALVTDFGVAKAISDAGGTTALTTVGVSLGTPAYMAPEQATADPGLDHRADLYALGVMAYEMLTGRLPFSRPTAQAILAAHLTETPQPLRELRPDVPDALATVVMRCLEKRAEDRYTGAADLLAELDDMLTSSGGVTPVGTARMTPAARRRRRVMGAVALVVLIPVVTWIVRGFRRHSQVQWIRAEAIPLIRALADSFQWEAAWTVAQRARAIAPNDSMLALVWPRMSQVASIHSDPSGARVYRRAFQVQDTSWQFLGVTPLDSVRVPLLNLFRGPQGLWRVRVEKDGFLPLEAVPLGLTAPFMLRDARSPDSALVRVPSGFMPELNLPGLEQLGQVTVDTFWIGVHEVTNRAFKAFVDNGGYRQRAFWTEPFTLNGRVLTWEEAMARFVDRTGRPGPATWEAGDYPAGLADHPVSGVSWYEASAYARYAGMALPTIFHWARAAGPNAAAWIIPYSNFDGRGSAPVASYRGVGPFGTFDMAGNVREWCVNADGSSRYILGGGWNDPGYAFNDAYTQPPFDRSPTNGMRLVRHRVGDTTLARLSRPARRTDRDFSRERPASDAIFQVYRRMYTYDRMALNGTVEPADSSVEDYVMQRVSYDAAYGRERVTAYLFLPKRGRPPYQTVVFFPGSNALNLRTFDRDAAVRLIDFILKSGRAVLYPVYKSTYERGDGFQTDIADESGAFRDHVIMWAKDFRRSVDYLVSRADIDSTRLAYYGISWGGAMGGLIPAVEPRLRAAVLQVAGLLFQRALPEAEPMHFLPRITLPVLMLNGSHDHYFPVETSQKPFFRLLGTPAQHKRWVLAEGGHFVPRNQVISETLDWLDRYLGPTVQ